MSPLFLGAIDFSGAEQDSVEDTTCVLQSFARVSVQRLPAGRRAKQAAGF